MLREYKTIDLFSGCGGMSLGFQNAGFSILAAYDNWKPAVDVYELNFEHPIYSEDLTDEKVQKRIKALKPNVIIGGPPCQDFSSAGHRDENLGRAVLTYTYRDIVLRIKPKYFVMENVPEITKSAILKEIKDSFKEAGYGLTERVLDDKADAALEIPIIKERADLVRDLRLGKADKNAQRLAAYPYRFREMHETTTNSLVIPSVSSENREYVPVGFVDKKTVVTNLAFVIYTVHFVFPP